MTTPVSESDHIIKPTYVWPYYSNIYERCIMARHWPVTCFSHKHTIFIQNIETIIAIKYIDLILYMKPYWVKLASTGTQKKLKLLSTFWLFRCRN